jgi:hypothetical protein
LNQAVDPVSGTTRYLYAIAGRTTGNTALATYEYLPVDLATFDIPGGATWTESATNVLGRGRWQLGAFAVDETVTKRIDPADTWIYAGGGANSAGTLAVDELDAALVLPGGALDTWVSIPGAAFPSSFAGYGHAAAANQLFVLGGQTMSPTTPSRSAQLCGAGYTCTTVPNIENWDAGIFLHVPRYLLGSAVGSAHIFLVGGLTSGNVPTSSVESTIW